MMKESKDKIICYNPATLELLGTAQVMNRDKVNEKVQKGYYPSTLEISPTNIKILT